MSEYTFAIPYTIELIHAARMDGDEAIVTACGQRGNIIDDYIRLDITEVTCRECMRVIGVEVGVIKDFFGPGKDLPAVGPKEMFERYRGSEHRPKG